jgi:formylglycine-generating enzyme required for sulfatase activity
MQAYSERNTMKTSVTLLAMLASALAIASPTATITSTTIADDVLTVEYTLDAPAVVTFDIQANGTSIGGEAVVSGILPNSDVWKKVEGSGTHTIKWRTDAWNGNASINAVVTAWPLDNPPNYMVADISYYAYSQTNAQRYYPEADFVPGGVLDNVRYRQTALLMRKVMAKGITWTMGGTSSARYVTLTNNYYMGVFEITKAQWAQVMGGYREKSASHTTNLAFTNLLYREMRPLEIVAYNEIRTSGSRTTYNAANDFPNPPHGSSFLGVVRQRTHLDFDLPGEAQWEFAARAGHGAGYWSDGSADSTVNGRLLGRCSSNGGSTSNFNCGPENGTAICGSYKPSDWGLYDVHGNVHEWCLDWYTTDTTALNSLDYRVNIDPNDPSKMLYPANTSGSTKVKKGGAWAADAATAGARWSDAPKTQWYNIGFRVMCPVEVP